MNSIIYKQDFITISNFFKRHGIASKEKLEDISKVISDKGCMYIQNTYKYLKNVGREFLKLNSKETT